MIVSLLSNLSVVQTLISTVLTEVSIISLTQIVLGIQIPPARPLQLVAQVWCLLHRDLALLTLYQLHLYPPGRITLIGICLNLQGKKVAV